MLIYYDEQCCVQNANYVFCLLQVWVNPRTPASPSCHGDTGPFNEGVAGWAPWESPTPHHLHPDSSTLPNLSLGHLPPSGRAVESSHSVCLLAPAPPSFCLPPHLSANPNHIIQRSRSQGPCHAPLLASLHHSRCVAAHPSTHWFSPWWGSGWQTSEVLMRTNGSHAGRVGQVSTAGKLSKTWKVDSLKMAVFYPLPD